MTFIDRHVQFGCHFIFQLAIDYRSICLSNVRSLKNLMRWSKYDEDILLKCQINEYFAVTVNFTQAFHCINIDKKRIFFFCFEMYFYSQCFNNGIECFVSGSNALLKNRVFVQMHPPTEIEILTILYTWPWCYRICGKWLLHFPLNCTL